MNNYNYMKVDTRKNLLLSALSEKDRALLIPRLQSMEFKAGHVIYEPGDDVQYAFFPCGATLISFIVLLDDARGVEAAMVGREGAIGGIISQGRLPAYCRAMVQFPGEALRISSVDLEKAKTESWTLRHFFARYADCLLAQIFQTVACNATHTIEQRTAKWLVAALDHTGGNTLPLTQEQLAGMLGVGRSYVARVLGGLKEGGTLETFRGKLHIHELETLRAIACNCNDQVREHFSHVLKEVYPELNS